MMESEVKIMNRFDDSGFMTTVDVAKALGCSVPTARRIMQRKDFPMVRVGKSMKVMFSAFRKWAESRHI